MISIILFCLLTQAVADEKPGTKNPFVDNQQLFLSAIPVTRAHKLANPRILCLTLHLQNTPGKKFGEVTVRYPDVILQKVSVSFSQPLSTYPRSADKATPQHKKSSFVVDFSEPVFRKITKEIDKQFGTKPTVEQLTRFTGRYIEKKTLNRGYNVASTVAATREGDCSEHAVLLVALARLYGIAARIVYGVALIEANGTTLALGHAWAEVYIQGKWRMADAALDLDTAKQNKVTVLAYLPVSVQKNEGPAFMRELLLNPGLPQIKSIDIK